MAEGDIGAVVAELEFDGADGKYPRIIHVAGDVYAIVYEGTDLDGWIKTVTISAAGALALVSGGSLEIAALGCEHPDIIHVAGDVYAVVYHDADGDGWIKTVTISAAGALALVSGGLLEIDDTDCNMPSITHVDGEVYAIAYTGPVSHGWIKTVTISAAGALALVGGGALEFDDTECYHPDIIHVAGDVYAVAYQEFPYDGRIKTVTISAAGALALVGGGSLEFETTDCYMPDLIHVNGEVYAIAYTGPVTEAQVKTVTISAAGALALVSGGSLLLESVNIFEPRIIDVSGDVYAVAYRGAGSDGWLKTVTIDAEGALALTGQSLEFDTLRCDYPDIIHIAGNMYAIAYAGNESDGWLKTMTIETVLGKIHHEMLMGIG